MQVASSRFAPNEFILMSDTVAKCELPCFFQECHPGFSMITSAAQRKFPHFFHDCPNGIILMPNSSYKYKLPRVFLDCPGGFIFVFTSAFRRKFSQLLQDCPDGFVLIAKHNAKCNPHSVFQDFSRVATAPTLLKMRSLTSTPKYDASRANWKVALSSSLTWKSGRMDA